MQALRNWPLSSDPIGSRVTVSGAYKEIRLELPEGVDGADRGRIAEAVGLGPPT